MLHSRTITTVASKTLLVAAVVLLQAVGIPTDAKAQSEGGLLLSVGAEKKLGKKLSLNLEADFRTRNNFKTVDRWSGSLGAEYKFTKWLKADAGYTLLHTNFREKITDYTSSKGNAKQKWRPSYWGLRHRTYVSLTADHKIWKNLRLSLRERWQYTYRPEAETTRWKLDPRDYTMELDDGYTRDGKGKNQLRSRLLLSWDQKLALFKPYGSVELYNSWAVEKIRYTVGTDIRLGRNHALDVFYRFQNQRQQDEEDYDPNMHYVGVGYKIKF